MTDLAPMAAPHCKDADCTLGLSDCCLVCGVYHGDPCHVCGQRGYHSSATFCDVCEGCGPVTTYLDSIYNMPLTLCGDCGAHPPEGVTLTKVYAATLDADIGEGETVRK